MLVQDIMQRGVVVVAPGAGVPEMSALLRRKGIRHLPVMDQGQLVGIVSDRDLKGALAPLASRQGEAREGLTAADIMTRALVTIAPMFPVEEAARLMVTRKISALPVTEGGRLMGIVTETDVLALFVEAMGVAEPSSRLDVALGDDPGALARVVQIVEAAAPRIASIMTFQSGVTGIREAVIRLATIDPSRAIRALEAGGYAVRDSRRS